jgi:hypothetical protein
MEDGPTYRRHAASPDRLTRQQLVTLLTVVGSGYFGCGWLAPPIARGALWTLAALTLGLGAAIALSTRAAVLAHVMPEDGTDD